MSWKPAAVLVIVLRHVMSQACSMSWPSWSHDDSAFGLEPLTLLLGFEPPNGLSNQFTTLPGLPDGVFFRIMSTATVASSAPPASRTPGRILDHSPPAPAAAAPAAPALSSPISFTPTWDTPSLVRR